MVHWMTASRLLRSSNIGWNLRLLRCYTATVGRKIVADRPAVATAGVQNGGSGVAAALVNRWKALEDGKRP